MRRSRDGCQVIGGRWFDACTGEAIDDPSWLDVDHTAALEGAHGSGGRAWRRERRAAPSREPSGRRFPTQVSLSLRESAAPLASGASTVFPTQGKVLSQIGVHLRLVRAPAPQTLLRENDVPVAWTEGFEHAIA